MGVRGLTTYVNLNQDAFLQYFLLHDTNLVVDGNSMCAQLYRSLNCFSAFGGDYDKFASYVKTFLKSFRKCNITPYVIFDGSHESRKLRTVYNRLRSKISGASRLDPVTQGSLQIFPLLVRDVFKQVLIEMNILYTICEFEADDEIATMARHLNCPVLSYDSDFFIYNVLYIPFNTLERKPKPYDVDGNRIHAMQCKLYKVEFLTENFGGLKEEMLPLLATLLGNDYVEKRVFNKFFSQLKLPKSKRCKNDQQRCIHGVFKWLQNETLDSAISKILGRVKKAGKDKVLAIIKKSIDGYNKKHCRSLKYFNISVGEQGEEKKYQLPENVDSENSADDDDDDSSESGEDSSEDEASSDDDNLEDDMVLGLPDWFADAVRNKLVPQSHLNLYTHHMYFCNPQAEDYKDEDSCLCTLPIMRYIFDILTDFAHDHCTYVSREIDCNYKRITLGREMSASRLLEVPFRDLTDEQLSLYFRQFIKEKVPLLDLADISLLPSNFQLFMISLLWWVDKCNVPLAHVHSLLMCYVMLEVVDERTGTFRGYTQFTNQYSKKVEEFKKKANKKSEQDDELFFNKGKVPYEDCLIAANALIKHFEIDETIRKRPKTYDVKKIHSFAQFQCCLHQFNSLNSLCRNPYEGTVYHKCYNGTFIYNIALKLENQPEPLKFFEQYLNGATMVLRFYRSLCNVYEKLAEKMNLNTVKWSGKKRRRKKNKNNDVEVDEIMNSFIIKGFASAVVL